MKRIVVIGAGHNGLAAAFYLAKAGFKPIVLEMRPTIGGGAVTGEVHPGFRIPTLTHHASVWSDVAQEMNLAAHGLLLLERPVEVFAPSPDGRAITLYRQPQRSMASIAVHSRRDADAFPLYRDSVARVADVIGSLLTHAPPDLDEPGAGDLWNLLGTGRRFRALGRRDAYRLLRWGPMPVADLVDEWFETDLLRATIAAPGVSGVMLGPRSAGSSLVLLLREAHALLSRGMAQIKGGPGALTAAMAAAATGAGAQIRTDSRVERIVTNRGTVTGVIARGEEVAADLVLSAVDPHTTFLKLVDPIELTPDFLGKIRNYRASGTMAKVNLALSSLPTFPAASGAVELLAGRIHIGPRLDDLERAFDHAKYGEIPGEPWLDITIPSILDPDLVPGGAHVMSIYVHAVPRVLRSGSWATSKDTLLESVLRVLERYSPEVRSLIVAARVLTPDDLESGFGFSGGHPFHGELSLDQLFTMRPLLGYAQYSGPIEGLYLCGAGTHPGGFMAGASGRLAARKIIDRGS